MLETLQRLWRRQPAPDPHDAASIEAWGRRRGEVVKHTRHGGGVVVEYRFAERAARVEWGPAQRPYMGQRELRVRVDLGVPSALEMMVMSRSLANRLEGEAYQRLVHGQQTEADVQMPEEARWLAMFQRAPLDAPYAAVMAPFVVLGASTGYARRWVEGELATRLARALTHWLTTETPLVIMVVRGRLDLRIQADALDDTVLDGVRLLGDCAAARALRALAKSSETPPTVYAALHEGTSLPVPLTGQAPRDDTAWQQLPTLRDAGPATDIEV